MIGILISVLYWWLHVWNLDYHCVPKHWAQLYSLTFLRRLKKERCTLSLRKRYLLLQMQITIRIRSAIFKLQKNLKVRMRDIGNEQNVLIMSSRPRAQNSGNNEKSNISKVTLLFISKLQDCFDLLYTTWVHESSKVLTVYANVFKRNSWTVKFTLQHNNFSVTCFSFSAIIDNKPSQNALSVNKTSFWMNFSYIY